MMHGQRNIKLGIHKF